jgi:hypothetical protein
MDPKQDDIGLGKRLFTGCLGALAPILVNLYVVDLQTTLANLLPLEAVSYAVRVLALCISACVIVYLNNDEMRPAKLFQLGIMAPAMLTSMLNGAVIANKTPSSPTTTPPAQILKGLVGITPNQWFVVVGSYGSAEAVVDDAKQINTRFPGKYQLQFCSPTTVPNSPYRVVIAQYMTYPDATKVKNNAIAAGFPSDTWLWNPFASTQQRTLARCASTTFTGVSMLATEKSRSCCRPTISNRWSLT